MGKGAKKSIIPSKKGNVGARAGEEEWGPGVESAGKGGLPEHEEGLISGARVWVSLAVCCAGNWGKVR